MIEIWGKTGNLPAEEIDTAENMKEAEYLIGEYRMAFGPGWRLWVKRIKRTQESANV